MAEAETAPIPKITVEEPPPPPPAPPRRRSLLSQVGDLPMRVIYKIAVVVVAVAVVTVAVVVFTVRDRSGGAVPEQTAAPSHLAGASPPAGAVPPGQPPAATPPVPASPPAAVPAVPVPSGSPSPSMPAAARPASKALKVALADKRIPKLPKRTLKLKKPPGKPMRVKKRLTDKRSAVVLPRLGKPWRVTRAKPYATRQVQRKVRGAMLVSLPVPVAVQAKPRDTALLAARWSLKRHPKGGKITWVASQSFKKKGWLLVYRVKYKVKGKKRSSMAAVLLVKTKKAKPALVFVTIPDSQRKRWRHINTVVSSVRARG
ncbi:hypothetical protein [Sinosporangium siamense]|uniref:Uncharacterized protein n=1 Tax=Sinosporangium siamense TaxID=1367973 RepID=A0A919RQJ0_9ACTN|nr:hypothetical protein [Sinosporangium siamense]GII97205.1 hypothetical protein Ssi02_74360 [Sinosporangium siamense]